MKPALPLTGQERFFDADQVIVSKTNPAGTITYANRAFLEVSEFTEAEVIGKPHNIIRHPDMPRCLFRKLWRRIKAGKEMFAYVVNRTHHGNHYWVLAHVTPSFDAEQRIIGFHSNRRLPERAPLERVIIPLYRDLRERERAAADPEAAVAAGEAHLRAHLEQLGVGYDRFIFSL